MEDILDLGGGNGRGQDPAMNDTKGLGKHGSPRGSPNIFLGVAHEEIARVRLET